MYMVNVGANNDVKNNAGKVITHLLICYNYLTYPFTFSINAFLCLPFQFKWCELNTRKKTFQVIRMAHQRYQKYERLFTEFLYRYLKSFNMLNLSEILAAIKLMDKLRPLLSGNLLNTLSLAKKGWTAGLVVQLCG